MPAPDRNSDVRPGTAHPADEAIALARLEARLPPLLSIIAGMVDLIGFFMLGNIFTAHITGNLVVAAADAVRGEHFHLLQILAIPVFIVALAAVWTIARASGKPAYALTRLLLWIQLVLLTAVLIFSVWARPSTDPHGVMAGIAVMICVSAMACQYALFRLALPGAVSTAVMTGNLTNAVLALMDRLSKDRPLMAPDSTRLKRSLFLLVGFLVGCLVAAVAVPLLADWVWALPVLLAVVALASCKRRISVAG
jgi:uncharacterized membrane protein YoaK (UPF0700 family)